MLSKRIQDDADFVGMLVILGQSKFYFVMPICFHNDDYRWIQVFKMQCERAGGDGVV